MRGGASYSVRGGSLRVRKVVTTNSQGGKTVKNLGEKNETVKCLVNLYSNSKLSNSTYFKSGYMKVGIPLEVRYFLMSLSVPYQLKLGVE